MKFIRFFFLAVIACMIQDPLIASNRITARPPKRTQSINTAKLKQKPPTLRPSVKRPWQDGSSAIVQTSAEKKRRLSSLQELADSAKSNSCHKAQEALKANALTKTIVSASSLSSASASCSSSSSSSLPAVGSIAASLVAARID